MQCNGIWWIVLSVVLAGAFAVVGVFVSQPPVAIASPPVFEDACVYSVVHPQIEVSLDRVIGQSVNCSTMCDYLFRVSNKTAREGTKAYQVRAWLVKDRQPFVLNGQVLQEMVLHGFAEELGPVYYPMIQTEKHFVISGLCPECVGRDRYITIVIEYQDCSGTRLYEYQCDLASQSIMEARQSQQYVGGCN